MSDSWFVFAVLAAIILCGGLVLVVALLRSVWAQREREALASDDLRAVEESAALLIEQLRTEADHAVAALKEQRACLTSLIEDADKKVSELTSLMADCSASTADKRSQHPEPGYGPDAVGPWRNEQILELASRGMGHAEIAKTVGLDSASVRLALSLSRLTKSRPHPDDPPSVPELARE
jgi:hypothetical protein